MKRGQRRGKWLHGISSELQHKYTFMHTMKASFPIVSVTTFLQCSLVYTGKYSFPQINNIDNNNNKKTSCLLINAVRPGHIFHSKLDPFLLHRSALTCCAWCIWALLTPLESRIIMPFVQKPWPFIAPSSKELVFRSIHKWYVDKHN